MYFSIIYKHISTLYDTITQAQPLFIQSYIVYMLMFDIHGSEQNINHLQFQTQGSSLTVYTISRF